MYENKKKHHPITKLLIIDPRGLVPLKKKCLSHPEVLELVSSCFLLSLPATATSKPISPEGTLTIFRHPPPHHFDLFAPLREIAIAVLTWHGSAVKKVMFEARPMLPRGVCGARRKGRDRRTKFNEAIKKTLCACVGERKNG